MRRLEWVKLKRLTMRSFGKNVEQLAVSYTASENVQ